MKKDALAKISKLKERQKLQADIDAFIKAGGKIEKLERNTTELETTPLKK